MEKIVWMQLVNVQSDSEFASHMLNRDTWRDDTVKTLIQGSFIFWQVVTNRTMHPKEMSLFEICKTHVDLNATQHNPIINAVSKGSLLGTGVRGHRAWGKSESVLQAHRAADHHDH